MYEYKARITLVRGCDLFDMSIDVGLGTQVIRTLRTKDFSGPRKDACIEEKKRAKRARARARELLENKLVTIKTYKNEDETDNIKYVVEIFLEDGRSYIDIMREEDLEIFNN